MRALPTSAALLSATSMHGVFGHSSSRCTGENAINFDCVSNEVGMTRDVFYVGGGYTYSATYKSELYSEQMYVEKLVSVHGSTRSHPLVFINAGLPSGAGWLNTPDGRTGWASYFVGRGYAVYVVDITGVGRSSQNVFAEWPLKIGSDVQITEDDYTAPETLRAYPQAVNHTQWPGNGTRGDPDFDAFSRSILPLTSNSTAQELSMRAAGCKLLHMIGRQAYLLSHSAGSTYPILMSDQCPDRIKGSINLEPGNTPFQNLVGNRTVAGVGYAPARPCGLTATLIGYDPPITDCSQLRTTLVGEDTRGNRSCYMQTSPARTLPNVARVPYVALTGAASPHITYDHCTVAFLEQAGVQSEWIRLGELGVQGNGHFLYLERNHLVVAEVVEGWIRGR
ncbi:alpha beta-hydrolase protein [Teratosphaeria destructans]|uniref:Alpha beta-hydrolase protein n=1 Tax=Teratosphaeria destructans TaxID=418781 RepID=A0A9W7SZG6_9PEZI|nr:alpha beta-hydrolase protein [Teratosphaeria destructans]